MDVKWRFQELIDRSRSVHRGRSDVSVFWNEDFLMMKFLMGVDRSRSVDRSRNVAFLGSVDRNRRRRSVDRSRGRRRRGVDRSRRRRSVGRSRRSVDRSRSVVRFKIGLGSFHVLGVDGCQAHNTAEHNQRFLNNKVDSYSELFVLEAIESRKNLDP